MTAVAARSLRVPLSDSSYFAGVSGSRAPQKMALRAFRLRALGCKAKAVQVTVEAQKLV